MMKIDKKVFFAIVLVLCLGCASAKTHSMVTVRPEHDEPTYRRLISLGTKVAQVIEGAPSDFRYGIIDTESCNAMVDTPHKTVYATKGLMNRLNDQEMLCILAHEWAHVTKGHYGERLHTTDVIDALSALVAFSNPIGMVVSAFANPLAKQSFSRTQEEEADGEAARVLHDRLGISPYACVSAFEKLRSYAERTGEREGGGLFDSHPAITARIKRLKDSWPEIPRVYWLSRIDVRTAEEAGDVVKRIQKGEVFTDLASSVSIDPLVKVNRGELGRFEEWELGPGIAEAFTKRKEQGIVVFSSQGGFVVVKFEERKESGLRGENEPSVSGHQ